MASPESIKSCLPAIGILSLGEDGSINSPSNEQSGSYRQNNSTASAAGEVSECDSLWNTALLRLSKEDQSSLKEIRDKGPGQDLYSGLAQSISRKLEQKARLQRTVTIAGNTFIVRDILRKMEQWLKRFKEIGDIAVSFDPVHAALPWAAFRFLLELGVSGLEQEDRLLVILEKAESSVFQGGAYEQLYLRKAASIGSSVRSRLTESLAKLYTAVLSSMVHCRRIFDRKFLVKALHATANPHELLTLIEDLDKRLEEVKINADICEKEGLSAELPEIRAILDRRFVRVDSALWSLRTKVLESEQGELLHWISPICYEDDHATASRDRAEGTGTWLFQCPEFQKWEESSSSALFWLQGQAGAGKTMLSSMVVNRYLEQPRANADEGLAYFYCQKQAGLQSQDDIFRSLLRQLSTSHAGTFSSIYSDWSDQRRRGYPSKHILGEKCKKLLPETIRSYAKTVLVVDGLDECSKECREVLLQALISIVANSTSLVKVFISSRDDKDFGGANWATNFEITPAHNQQDIELFVREKADRLFLEVSESTTNLILETFRSTAKGMFLWAKLQIDCLIALEIEDDVTAYLNRMPTSLKKTYDETWNSIWDAPGSMGTIALRAMRWMLCSRRLLSTSELVAAVQINVDERQDRVTGGIAAQHTRIRIETVLQACRHFVVVTKDGGEDVCRFAHLTVQEYLLKHQIRGEDASSYVARVCLRYLTEPSFLHMRKVLEPHILRWFEHVRLCNPDGPGDLERLLHRFLGGPNESSRFYQAWLASVAESDGALVRGHSSLEPIVSSCTPATRTALGIIHLELFGALDAWIERMDVSVANDSGQTLLHMAAEKGLQGLYEPLLGRGASLAAADKEGNSPLATAIYSGKHYAATFLLQCGADPNAGMSRYGGSSVIAAISGCWDDGQLACILVEMGADIDISAEPHGTALQWAAHKAYYGVVACLAARCGGLGYLDLDGRRPLCALFLAYRRLIAASDEFWLDHDHPSDDMFYWMETTYASFTVQNLVLAGAVLVPPEDMDAGLEEEFAEIRRLHSLHPRAAEFTPLSSTTHIPTVGPLFDAICAFREGKSGDMQEICEAMRDEIMEPCL